MNIKVTGPAAQQKSNITISVPKVDSQAVAEGTWDVLDTVETFAGRSGYALLNGVGGAVPLLGYNLSKHIRNDLGGYYSNRSNSVNQVSNAAAAVAQVGGMATGALGAVALIANHGSASVLFPVAGGLFAVAGLSTAITAFSTDGIEELTGNFGS